MVLPPPTAPVPARRAGRWRFVAGAALCVAIVATAAPFTRSGGLPSVPPRINDITTDTVTPPELEALLPLRPAKATPPAYDPAFAPVQRRAYPDLAPVVLPLARREAFALALDAARRLGWDIVAADEARGRIEAVDTTFFLRFKDDVVVRLVEDAPGATRVDVRSKSRIGRSDFGKNAGRIRAYLALLRP